MAALKIFGATGGTPESVSIEALNYAIAMGFPIINNSWGGSPYSNALFEALQNGETNGNLFICSAGNYGYDNDIYPYYPATYPLSNIISVANTDRNDALYVDANNWGSHYGATTVDIAAPGTNIFSTLPNNTYGNDTGTSMAAPHITGACALLWELYPTKTYAEIKSAILNSVDLTPAMAGKCVSNGRLNLHKTLEYFNVVSSCREQDSLALVSLYHATNGPNWTNTWDLNQPMNGWYGVTLNGEGCVTVLSLVNNQLNGNIPPQIGSLSNLINLNLSNNQLRGDIPPQIGNLNSLINLYLFNNQLSGNIPSQIGDLSSLTILSLGSNQLSGSIPPELGNLTNLYRLYLTGNQLSGSIPSQIGNLSNLEDIRLYSNQLSGSIPPELGNLSNLALLYLSFNQLSSSIPSTLGNLSNLNILDLSSNQLSGSIPSALGNLSNLSFLAIDNNQLSGCYDENVTSLCSQIFTSNLYISNGNNFDATWEDCCNTGAGTCIPDNLCRQSDSLALVALYNATTGANWTNTWDLNQSIDTWYGVALDENGCVSCIDMDGYFDCIDNDNSTGNNLLGSLPAEMGDFDALVFLDLSANQLNGSIPNQISNLIDLTYLNLENNNLSGSIPLTFGDLNELTYLNLSFNQLSNNIPPELGNSNNLKALNFWKFKQFIIAHFSLQST